MRLPVKACFHTSLGVVTYERQIRDTDTITLRRRRFKGAIMNMPGKHRVLRETSDRGAPGVLLNGDIPAVRGIRERDRSCTAM